jgi:muconolactone delta-isomerase
MLYFGRFDVHQPESMSIDQLMKIWYEEAQAALGAMDAGAVKGLWKVAGQRVVLALLDFPDHDSLDQALGGLPIMQQMGGSVELEVLPVRDYRDFAEDLKAAAQG